jgi:hypothetical protein
MKDNPGSRHHVYTTDHYCNKVVYVNPQEHINTLYKYKATNPQDTD